MKVIKRDGSTVDFDRSKIVVAIQKANNAVDESERIAEDRIENIAHYVESRNRMRLLVEDIQDMVEHQLMQEGKFDLAKAYIIYRYTRALVRKANTARFDCRRGFQRLNPPHYPAGRNFQSA